MATAVKSKQSKKAKQSKPSKQTVPSVGVRFRNWFFRPAILIVASFLAGVIVLAPFIPYLLPDLSGLPEYQFSMEEIQVNAPNEWIPPTLLDDVLQESRLPATVSLLERDLCRQVAVAFAAHPWVRNVESVHVTGDPALWAVIDYRRPVAFIESEQGLFPVDQDGVLLPSADFSISDMDRLPHITNVQTTPHEVGEPWGDVVVASAAVLAEALCPQGDLDRFWHRYGLQSIIVPNAPQEDANDAPLSPGDLTFELNTTNGNRIVWGNPPGADELEQTVEQKLERLEFLSQVGELRRPDGPFRIDIRPFEEITYQPLGFQ